jgi:hypothetical protein
LEVLRDMANIALFERFSLWGWILMVVTVIAFVVGLGLSMVIGTGLNGISTLPILFTSLIGLAVVFVGGFTIFAYGRIRIRLSRRST